ncbi:MAG: hypothetical protein CFE23_10555 [Flavobacterium sp. BFFFF1]|uniref:glycosyltransferase n=1 Tax=Flavobacterium sp. BFFFF1 TaxID=2015557 RepID=UPI000BD7835F|nr:glycosyltransferase [Flavobacterium sp. BFFFF1]OYU80153.1 MAG: hypothetical protein CFE23_10555 [Flavobacterium sp. BFFFF1]
MPEKRLHIVSFDYPYPPDFGGIIDVFFKIKALHKIGYKIYLHTFSEEIPKSCPELEAVTERVFYYRFSYNPLLFFSGIPYSVMSRNDSTLLNNLKSIDAPILFEALKTTYLVNKKQLEGFKKILRLHNIEQDYYKGVSKSEKSLVKKIAFAFEQLKYQSYEQTIRSFNHVLALSRFEEQYINRKFGNASYVPVFHGNESVAELGGSGTYALYHGDLNTADNRKAVRFLIDAFADIPGFKLVIASGSGESFVRGVIRQQANVEFVPLVDFNHLKSLMMAAHINISWSFQKSGTKLKVVNALFNGRFCIINNNIIDDPAVSDLCITAKDRKQLINAVNRLKAVPFDDYERRQQVLKTHLDDGANALLIDQILSETIAKVPA